MRNIGSCKLRKIQIIFLLFIIVSSLLIAVSYQKARGQENISEALSIIMVIDVSGSMRWTDPEMLRETAAHVFIDLLSTEDNIGIIIFDHQAEVVFPLQGVQSLARKEQIKNILSPVLAPRGDTDFLVALEAAHNQLSGGNLQGTRPVVVLLTDGDPDPDPSRRDDPVFMDEYMDKLWNMVNRFALDGYPIFTVGFSDEIDPEVIEKMSVDSQGDYYLLNEPGELLLSFFELLGNLKNRRGFLNETVTLSGQEQSFAFQVNEMTRQVNFVAAATNGENVRLDILPPEDDGFEVEGVTVANTDTYSMGIIYQPTDDFWGEWQVKVSGSGEIRVLGDMDLFVKAWLEEPVPLSKHPLHEPINFKVAVTGVNLLQEAPLQAEVEVTRPGETIPLTVPLTQEEGYFTGVLEEINRVGTYDLLVRLLLDEETISTQSSRLYVRRLPVLQTDFWGGGIFRQGEELLITASLNVANRRITEGSELQLDAIQFVFFGENQEESAIPLFDSGDPEHGDIRAGDGIYSNRLLFEDQEGSYSAALKVVGRYLDEDFILEKNLEPFQVYPPGIISVEMGKQEFWSIVGGKVTLPLKIHNRSQFRETLYFDLQEDVGRLGTGLLNLEPGEMQTVSLELDLFESLGTGIHPAFLSLRADHALTKTQPAGLEFSLEITTARQVFLNNLRQLVRDVGPILAVIIAILFVFFAGGYLLYRLRVFPSTLVRGSLVYESIGNGGFKTGLAKTFNFSRKKKNPIVVSFNPESKDADFRIEGSEFSYDLVIKSYWDTQLPAFLQGWKVLFSKHVPIKTVLNCTPPGIIEHEGQIYTEKELFHEDEFDSGDFVFKYDNPYGKWYREHYNHGVDVLEEKGIDSEA